MVLNAVLFSGKSAVEPVLADPGPAVQPYIYSFRMNLHFASCNSWCAKYAHFLHRYPGNTAPGTGNRGFTFFSSMFESLLIMVIVHSRYFVLNRFR